MVGKADRGKLVSSVEVHEVEGGRPEILHGGGLDDGLVRLNRKSLTFFLESLFVIGPVQVELFNKPFDRPYEVVGLVLIRA